jgi:hypothetical protein
MAEIPHFRIPTDREPVLDGHSVNGLRAVVAEKAKRAPNGCPPLKSANFIAIAELRPRPNRCRLA